MKWAEEKREYAPLANTPFCTGLVILLCLSDWGSLVQEEGHNFVLVVQLQRHSNWQRPLEKLHDVTWPSFSVSPWGDCPNIWRSWLKSPNLASPLELPNHLLVPLPAPEFNPPVGRCHFNHCWVGWVVGHTSEFHSEGTVAILNLSLWYVKGWRSKTKEHCNNKLLHLPASME